MARVNVEGRALAEGRFFTLAEDLEMHRAEAIGMLVIFWFESQERRVYKGTKDELLKFIPYRGDKALRVFDAMLANDYLSKASDGTITIRGNKKHVDALIAMEEGGRQGGIKSVRSRLIALGDDCLGAQGDDEPGARGDENDFEPPEPFSNESQGTPSYNTKQCKAKQSKTEKKTEGRTASENSHPLVKIWNEHRGTLPECKGLGKERKRHSDARWKENPEENYWVDIVKRIAASPFCRGEGSRGWRADFDFFVRASTHLKVLEGKYDGPSKPPDGPKTKQQAMSENNQRLFDLVKRGEI